MSIYTRNTGRFEDGEPVEVLRLDRRQPPTGQVMVTTAGIAAFLIDFTLDEYRTLARYQMAADGAGLARWAARRLQQKCPS